jgi:hypothetical protein
MKQFPQARTKEIIVQELPGEVLIYDQRRQKAHCLNETSAFVWKHCDGQTSISELAALFAEAEHGPAEEPVIRLALDQLASRHLLDADSNLPRLSVNLSRRTAIRAIVAAVVLLPLVTSVSAGDNIQVVSCKANGVGCESGSECCSGCCLQTCQPPANCLRG